MSETKQQGRGGGRGGGGRGGSGGRGGRGGRGGGKKESILELAKVSKKKNEGASSLWLYTLIYDTCYTSIRNESKHNTNLFFISSDITYNININLQLTADRF